MGTCQMLIFAVGAPEEEVFPVWCSREGFGWNSDFKKKGLKKEAGFLDGV